MKKKFLLSVLAILLAGLFCGCDHPGDEYEEWENNLKWGQWALQPGSKLNDEVIRLIAVGSYYFGHSSGLTHDTDFQFYFRQNTVTITAKGEIPWTIAYKTLYDYYPNEPDIETYTYGDFEIYEFGFNSQNERDPNDIFGKSIFRGKFVEDTYYDLDGYGHYLYVEAQTPSGKEFTILLEKVDKAVFK